ncbi:hypothetical protein ACFS4T_28220 [Pseudomonas lini]
MGRNGQRALGYRPGDAGFFKQWIIAKTEPASERRAVLATPPIRAVAEHETLLLVRGAFASRAGETLQERIQDLHSDFSDDEVDTFADALIARGDALRAIEQREDELDELRVILNRWEYQQPETWGGLAVTRFVTAADGISSSALSIVSSAKKPDSAVVSTRTTMPWTCPEKCCHWIWRPGGQSVLPS